MSESTKSKKRQPSWLTGEEIEAKTGAGARGEAGGQTRVAEPPPSTGPGGRKGPLAEDDTGEISRVQHEPSAAAPTETIPRVAVPGAGKGQGAERNTVGNSPAEIAGRLRENPAPLAIAVLALLVVVLLLWVLFFRGGNEERPFAVGRSADGVIGAQEPPEDPFGSGPVRDSGVVFGAMQESGEEATLDGAGLSWSGTVSEKEGEEGQTVTLEGPTAAQLERGFDLGSSDVETGVYAVAQDGGEVLHVTTQSFVPQEEGTEADEMTLGTVYSLEEGRLDGYAYYLDQREPGADRVTRTYVRPGQSSYRVSFDAPPAKAAQDGDRNGTFVPLLVGWRGFEDGSTNQQEGG